VSLGNEDSCMPVRSISAGDLAPKNRPASAEFRKLPGACPPDPSGSCTNMCSYRRSYANAAAAVS
jgi:hypothetical protein